MNVPHDLDRVAGSIDASLSELRRVYPVVEDLGYGQNRGEGGRSPVGESDPTGGVLTNEQQEIARQACIHAIRSLVIADRAVAEAVRSLRPYGRGPRASDLVGMEHQVYRLPEAQMRQLEDAQARRKARGDS